MTSYYLWREDAEEGPYTAPELWARFEAGQLAEFEPVRIGRHGEWLQIADVIERLDREAHPVEVVIPPRPLTQSTTPPLPRCVPAPVRAARPASRDLPVPVVVIAFGTLFFCIILFGNYAMKNPGDSSTTGPKNRDAYHTAQDFVRSQFPGADSFSEYNGSVIKTSGNRYQVAMYVDGRNAFGGPIRKRVVVEMDLIGNRWHHVRTIQD